METTDTSTGIKSFLHNKETYFVVTKIYADNTCDITVSSGVTCWKTSLESVQICSLAKDTGMNPNEYALKMKSALQEEDTPNIEFELSQQSEAAEFKWKTVENDIKFCLGVISLPKVEAEIEITKILTQVCQDLHNRKNMLTESKQHSEYMEKRYIQAVESLETCTQLKQKMEDDLILKFVLLINEKKAKIRKLIEQNKNYVEAIGILEEKVKNMPEAEMQPSTSRGFSGEKPLRKMSSSSSETDDACPVIIKRKTPLPPPQKILPASPIKPMETSTSVVTGLSDIAVTTSSDSTVDINEMIGDM